MKAKGSSWCFGYLMLLTAAAGIQVREPDQDVTTEPTDNGQAVGEPPEIQPTGSQLSPQILKDLEDEVSVQTVTTTHDTTPSLTQFPNNHKNYTHEETSNIELPPFMQQYNKFQQQYKEFYAQKNEYAASAKPFKFEDLEQDPQKTRLLTQGLSAFGNEGADSRPRQRFPYPYENDAVTAPAPSAYPLPDNNLDQEENPADEDDFSALFPFPGLPSPIKNLFGTFPPRPKPEGGSESEGHRSEISHSHKGIPPWKRALKILSTVLPVGLFLATLTPNLIYINSTNTDNSKPSRVRSDGVVRESRSSADPLMLLVERLGGVQALLDPQCDDRIFCEMSMLGRTSDGNVVERGAWYLANKTPDKIAEEVGMKELFQAIRNGTCEIFKCPEKITKENTTEASVDIPEQHKDSKKVRKFKKFVRS